MMDSITVGAKNQMTENITGDYPVNSTATILYIDEIYNNDLEVTAMLKTPELAMPRTRKVTTVCNGKREVWTDYEQAKAYFLELMMTAEGDERERAEMRLHSALTRAVDMFRRR